MSRTIMLIPVDVNVGLTSVFLGLINIIQQKNISLGILELMSQSNLNSIKKTNSHTNNVNSKNNINESLDINYIELISDISKKQLLIEEIITRYYKINQNNDIILIKGLSFTSYYLQQFINILNYEIANALNAEIIFISKLNYNSIEKFKNYVKLAILNFNSNKNKKIIGIIINKINAPVDINGNTCFNFLEILNNFHKKKSNYNLDLNIFLKHSPLPVLGCIPWNIDLIAVRVIDVIKHLKAKIIYKGNIHTHRLRSITICIQKLPNILNYFHSNSLLIISSDRIDILIAAYLTTISDVKIGAVLLTDSYKIDKNINKLCKIAFKTKLPIFAVQTNILQTLLNLQNFDLKVPWDDFNRIKKLKNYIEKHINSNWIKSFKIDFKPSFCLSSSEFCHRLIELARQVTKRIILPESEEPRILKAANTCTERNIAHCILLGNPEKIQYIATKNNIKLNQCIEIIDPKTIRNQYINRLVELRKDKGMTAIIADRQLKDNVVLATMMLKCNEVDGLVSGAVHTTANTIRPSLQLIKTSQGNSLISSIFFMLLPDQVLIYGDCAINPNPTAEQLAEIAIQSAKSAIIFGIEPRVAMISYSTGNSGAGKDVEKVLKATYLAKRKVPNLLIDGPLQYDAAIMTDVALLKAPNSPVAGKATVFIFPDLNTGNTTYKAVQRSANLNTIGPMLQGMSKPVNDLSRGALVNDIVYTIALTVVQSK